MELWIWSIGQLPVNLLQLFMFAISISIDEAFHEIVNKSLCVPNVTVNRIAKYITDFGPSSRNVRSEKELARATSYVLKQR